MVKWTCGQLYIVFCNEGIISNICCNNYIPKCWRQMIYANMWTCLYKYPRDMLLWAAAAPAYWHYDIMKKTVLKPLSVCCRNGTWIYTDDLQDTCVLIPVGNRLLLLYVPALYDCQSKNPCKTILRDSTFRHKDDDKFVRCTKSGSCTVLSCSNRKKYIPISGTCSK